jgi:hypothetical protein
LLYKSEKYEIYIPAKLIARRIFTKSYKIKIKIIAFIAACPKSLNSIYGTHKPLGVNKPYIN